MSTPPDRRTRKRLATRQTISDVATRLFLERGFDAVTMDEVAAAADVGRMTVFNHFPRKEDLFFDRDEEARVRIADALRQRDPAVSPIEALRLLAHRLVADEQPYIRFFDKSRKFVETVEASETLKARARAIRDELTHFVATALCDAVRREGPDREALLAANLLLATWSIAFIEAHRAFRQDADPAQAQAVFLALVDRGSIGLASAMAGTPYG